MRSNSWSCCRTRPTHGQGAGSPALARPLLHRGAGIFVGRHPQVIRTCPQPERRDRQPPERNSGHLRPVGALLDARPSRPGARARRDAAREGRTARDPLSLGVGHRVLGSTLFTAGEFVARARHLERAVALGLRAATENAPCPTLSTAHRRPADAGLGLVGTGLSRAGSSHRIPGAGAGVGACRSLHGRLRPLCGFGRATAARAVCGLPPARGSKPDLSSEHRINLYALYSRFGRGCAFARMGREEQAISEIRAGSRTRAQQPRIHARVSCSDGLAPYKFRPATPKPRCPPSTTRWRKSTSFRTRVGGGASRLRADACWRCVPARRLRRSEATRKPSPSRRTSRPARWNCERRRRWHGCCRARANPRRRVRSTSIYGWFPEGLDTADLSEAKGLLDELSSHASAR